MDRSLAAGQVTCIACGRSVDRAGAREYDKYGNRWDRDGKSFEYLCKPCFRDLTKQPRDGLEADLATIRAGRISDDEFFRRFASLPDGDDCDPRRYD